MSIAESLKGRVKDLLPDAMFLSLSHRRKVGRFPNVEHPLTFNEKILHRCLHPDPCFAHFADKLLVRDYVTRTIGDAYLIPLLATPEPFTRADFDALPRSFVMKVNHASNFVKIVRDKSETTFEELHALAAHWLSTNFYRIARERHYKGIRPRLFFEQLLLDEHGDVPADIKVHCFTERTGKKNAYIMRVSDRFTARPCGDFFDEQWNLLHIAVAGFFTSPTPAPRPDNLAQILATAKALAADFDYVRVDLYALGDRIYFGELTFTPGAGVDRLYPDKVDYDWGRLFHTCSS
jgi:hypothetical protein